MNAIDGFSLIFGLFELSVFSETKLGEFLNKPLCHDPLGSAQSVLRWQTSEDRAHCGTHALSSRISWSCTPRTATEYQIRGCSRRLLAIPLTTKQNRRSRPSEQVTEQPVQPDQNDYPLTTAGRFLQHYCSTSSTRRFFSRPSSVRFVATGANGPRPRVIIRAAEIP